MENYNETIVIEALLPEIIGSNPEDAKKVINLMHKLVEDIGALQVAKENIDLSPCYGYSGWIVARKSDEDIISISLYVWDKPRPFISVDILRRRDFHNIKDIAASHGTISTSLNISAQNIVTKTTIGENQNDTEKHSIDNSTWRELAPDIYRQRVAINGKFINEAILTDEFIEVFLSGLCEALFMKKLSAPQIVKLNKKELIAWMHWETSGVVLKISENFAEVVIYTCKSFFPDDAIKYVQKHLGIMEVKHVNF